MRTANKGKDVSGLNEGRREGREGKEKGDAPQ
jgi:hypothetical protein